MFSSKNQLLKRTPENGTDRESFLSLLVDEYLHSSSYGKYLNLINVLFSLQETHAITCSILTFIKSSLSIDVVM